MPFVRLKRNWPSGFRRTIATRVLEFSPGDPVEVTTEEREALAGDIGVALEDWRPPAETLPEPVAEAEPEVDTELEPVADAETLPEPMAEPESEPGREPESNSQPEPIDPKPRRGRR